MLVRKENKIVCRRCNHKVSKESEYRWGSPLDQQTKDIINKAVRDVMNIHPFSEDCRYKVSDVEVWSSEDEEWVEGKGTVDFKVSFYKPNLFATEMEISFCPTASYDCYYKVVLKDNSNPHIRPYHVKNTDFTKDYRPTRNTPYTYLSSPDYFYSNLKDLLFESLDNLKEGLNKKGISL